jgi:hypothetical protein
VTSEIKCVFCVLIGIYLLPVEKYLFRSLAHFHIELFDFVLLGCKSFLYILGTSFILVCDLRIFFPIQ